MHDPTIASIRINGGRLCLDFVNTAAWESGEVFLEFLRCYQDLLVWGGRKGLIGDAEIDRLARAAGSATRDAEEVLRSAITLRAALRVLLEPCRSREQVHASLTVLNDALGRHAGEVRLEATADGARPSGGSGLASWLIGPVAISASELLLSTERARVKACGGDGCHWLFLDASRGGTRRWCSMQSCGNRAKAKAHYDTHRARGARRAGTRSAGASG